MWLYDARFTFTDFVIATFVFLISVRDRVAIFDAIFKYPYIRCTFLAHTSNYQVCIGYITNTCDFGNFTFYICWLWRINSLGRKSVFKCASVFLLRNKTRWSGQLLALRRQYSDDMVAFRQQKKRGWQSVHAFFYYNCSAVCRMTVSSKKYRPSTLILRF